MVSKIKGLRDDGAPVGNGEDHPDPPVEESPAPTPMKSPSVKSPAGVKSTPIAKKTAPKTPTSGIPADYAEIVTNDEYVLALPHIMFGWKDSSENARTTLMVFLPTGMTKSDVMPRIEEGGFEVKIELGWAPVMSDSRLPMFAGTSDGTAFYQPGHIKVVSFNESVKALRGNDESVPIVSTFRCELEHPVEEQFSDVDVPASLYTVKYKIAAPVGKDGTPTGPPQDAWCLILEMMNIRTNYKSKVEIEDFCVDFDSLML